MPVVCLGISHHTAPVAVREQLALGPEEQRVLLADLAGGRAAAALDEVAVLSTCNRTELYAAAADVTHRFREAPPLLTEVLAGRRGLAPSALGAKLYARMNTEAVRHLCRVAAGLDSMVLGEAEILGQVSAAHELAKRERTLGPVLDATFRTAVRAGRRARSETGIGRRAASVSSEAARLVRAAVPDLGAARLVVVGTGRAGGLAAEALRKGGARDLRVVSRTAQHADALARRLGAVPLPWHSLESELREADVVVSCTGAPHAVLTRELIASACRGRAGGRELLLVDIAVPRDVEPAVRAIPGVRVWDLDHLQRRVDGNLALRREDAQAAEAIVDEEVLHFEQWRQGVELRPTLVALFAQGDALRRLEVERALRRLGPVAPEVREQIEALSRALVGRLMRGASQRLRSEADPERRSRIAATALELFGLGVKGPGGDGGDGMAA